MQAIANADIRRAFANILLQIRDKEADDRHRRKRQRPDTSDTVIILKN
jgi:hypothetical protein